jgi:hypothetical protein
MAKFASLVLASRRSSPVSSDVMLVRSEITFPIRRRPLVLIASDRFHHDLAPRSATAASCTRSADHPLSSAGSAFRASRAARHASRWSAASIAAARAWRMLCGAAPAVPKAVSVRCRAALAFAVSMASVAVSTAARAARYLRMIGAGGVGGPKRVTRSRIDGTNGRSILRRPVVTGAARRERGGSDAVRWDC